MSKMCTAALLFTTCLVTIIALFVWGVPAEIPNSNDFLNDFVEGNWILLLLMWNIFKALFPNSKVLEAIGSTISSKFPVFKQPERRRTDKINQE